MGTRWRRARPARAPPGAGGGRSAGLGAGGEHPRAQPELLRRPSRARARGRVSPPSRSHLLSTSAVAHPPPWPARPPGGPGRSRRRRRRRPRARRRRARPRGGSAAPCSTRATRRILACRRSPAVSTTTTGSPSTSIGRSIASRVVPATSETITRSEPRKRLTSEDLPTFGRPITARRTARRPRSAPSRQHARRSGRAGRPVPSPCAAETATGSPSPRPWNSAASASSRDASRPCSPPRPPAAARGGACRPSPRRRAEAGLRVDDEQATSASASARGPARG